MSKTPWEQEGKDSVNVFCWLGYLSCSSPQLFFSECGGCSWLFLGSGVTEEFFWALFGCWWFLPMCWSCKSTSGFHILKYNELGCREIQDGAFQVFKHTFHLQSAFIQSVWHCNQACHTWIWISTMYELKLDAAEEIDMQGSQGLGHAGFDKSHSVV